MTIPDWLEYHPGQVIVGICIVGYIVLLFWYAGRGHKRTDRKIEPQPEGHPHIIRWSPIDELLKEHRFDYRPKLDLPPLGDPDGFIEKIRQAHSPDSALALDRDGMEAIVKESTIGSLHSPDKSSATRAKRRRDKKHCNRRS
jgi:hypothetical protein